MRKGFYIIIVFGLLSYIGCRPAKVVKVDLPEHEPYLIVEAYLEPGLPKTVILQESAGYFDAPQIKSVANALVIISNGVRRDTLQYVPIQLGPFQFGVYTLIDPASFMQADYDREYTLDVVATLSNGTQKTAKATTRLLRPVEIEETVHVFDGRPEPRAYITGYYQDPPNEKNYYRVVFINPSTSIYPLPSDREFRDSIIDYTFPDELTNGQRVPFGSPPFFEPGEEVRIKLIHINEDYFKYLESLDFAVAGNGSPFVEPFNVVGNVQGEGVRGIFTTLSYVLYRDTVPIP
jgi:hypothetical protein